MFGCSFQRGVEPKRRLFDLLHDVMCWWLVPFIQMRWIFYDDGELSSCLTTRWMGVKEKKVSYSRRTCCFYLLLKTWFVFCFPRVCILVYMYVLPKKGEIFTAWLWPHCHNYDVAGEYLSSLANVLGELWCVCDDVVLVPLLLFFDRCRIMDNLL